jgi:hypothetical protein
LQDQKYPDMKMHFFFIFFFFVMVRMSAGQTPTQTVRGKVVDAASKTGLPGANVVIQDLVPMKGAATNEKGIFVLTEVPVGRHALLVTFMGYKPVVIPEITVISGKETVLNVELEEMIVGAKEVEIKATIEKDKPVNTMAMISARSFNVDESRRYAGAADDPMRAVSNFAGVASSADVNSNQIIIRGNSPKGLLWKVDGAEIPNPNHYAYVGTSGGGITMFSSMVLSNSDFYTAAFPAEFGNALSGVFDMRFRTGNNVRREYAVQVGIQGLDLSAEGPFVKGKQSSYLFNYRYSILSFLQVIDPSMKNKIPSYQDLSFKLNFPTKKAGTFAVTGIGGISRSTYQPVLDSTQWKTLDDRTQSTLNNNMGAIIVSHQIPVSPQTIIRSYLSATYGEIFFDNNFLNTNYEPVPQQRVQHRNWRFTAFTGVNHKFGPRHTNRSGIQFSKLYYDLDIRALNPGTGIFSIYNKGNGNTSEVRAFSESKISITENLTITAGIQAQFFFLNSDYAVEPRLAFRWQFVRKHAFSLGYGMHSQHEDIGVYLSDAQTSDGSFVQPNRNLNLSRAHHFVLGYDFQIRSDLRFKSEIYYQYLYSIPVKPGNYYSLINSEGWYSNDTLVNTGSGTNAGIDLTLEKFLSKQYYFLATVSLFQSKYKGGDGIERNTKFNTGFVVNLLGGKEWTIRKKNVFGVNLKLNITGGEYYVPIDLQESIKQNREVLDESAAYSLRLPDFYYVDLAFSYRINHKRSSSTFCVQLKNLLNQKPDIGYAYNSYTKTIDAMKSMGIIPFISYKIEF